MAYNTLLHRLLAVNLHGIKLGLENMQRLCAAFDHPHQKLRTVHVAGTNGKGSVAGKIAKGFELSGKKTGLYTSPHLSSFRERIQIQGCLIPEKAVERLLPQIFEKTVQNNISATFFEITTLLAFLYFLSENVDVAILETGLGGRLDATNVVMPDISVITSISLDHTQFLGNSIEEIAKEKGGIIKSHVPVVIGPRVPMDIIAPLAARSHSPCYQAQGIYDADFDLENQAVAQMAMQQLGLPQKHIQKALGVRPPCRREVCHAPGQRTVVLDVAHNPDGLHKLFAWIQMQYPKKDVHAVCGLSKGKDLAKSAVVLKTYASTIYVTEAINGRGIPAEELQAFFQKEGFPASKLFHYPTISESLNAAASQLQP